MCLRCLRQCSSQYTIPLMVRSSFMIIFFPAFIPKKGRNFNKKCARGCRMTELGIELCHGAKRMELMLHKLKLFASDLGNRAQENNRGTKAELPKMA